ncbi:MULTISPECIES: DUF2007 domain-containing protein [Pseudoalteromonas]|uniref:RanBP2-type domain-containing protein n=1 Tax=Pseudoalteromonas peptidolytica F12-50-A1 TaxID=1315280 RepID=A0A8I0T2B7_9GAMM|nr:MULTISPECIES: DUF2007 domain-containing protein [Pseudoalteromonas]MBE0345286.1 hypothetical protein [Pseudoalteromonas peptidolytica F12-50-A1]MDW7547382.1 DUF2007 domain-containing protein [Pseudoalteromonas peptidolytica]NLR16869.1 DUF2007 domain-containing protein [Pseudoalteromonas peptidolytica]RRS07680.1 DUF2007 domain-containing protein [Pseudoalteromonas sp. J010]RXF05895.1 DUF2007 domain-containing protein [Pseudoalteromonas sp. PS5]
MSVASFRWQQVYSTTDFVEAHLLKGMLEQANIQVRLQGEHLSGAMGEIPLEQAAIKLLVYAIKLPEAEKLLVNYNKLRRHSAVKQADWQCHHCTEINGPAFEYCWQCGSKHE